MCWFDAPCCVAGLFLSVTQALDVDPATGELEGDEEGFPEDYPLEQLQISTADFMAKVCFRPNPYMLVEACVFWCMADGGWGGTRADRYRPPLMKLLACFFFFRSL